MAVNYSLAYLSCKPGEKNPKKKYYAKAQASGEVCIDEIAEDIAYATSMTDGDVLSAIRGLIKQLNRHLAAGKIVRLENFGSFQLQLQSNGTETEKEFTSANITDVSIQFRPGNSIKAATRAGSGGLTFHRVPKLKDAVASGTTDTTEPDGGSTSNGDSGGTDEDNPME